MVNLSLNGWHALLCIANNRYDVTITTHAIKRHFLIWMTTVRQPTKRRRSCVLTLNYTFICVYWWTRQRIHNSLIVVDRYLRLMGDKTIPDSAEPRLESFYPPFVAGIDLPHQGVVDSYNLHNEISHTGKMTSLYWIRALVISLRTEFLIRNINRYLPLLSFLHIDISQVVRTLPCVRQGIAYCTQPVSGCWWPGSARNQGISSHDIDLIKLR